MLRTSSSGVVPVMEASPRWRCRRADRGITILRPRRPVGVHLCEVRIIIDFLSVMGHFTRSLNGLKGRKELALATRPSKEKTTTYKEKS